MTDGGAGEDLLTFENVRVISEGQVLICEYQGSRFGLPTDAMEPGTTIRKRGDVGVLVIKMKRAQAIGLDLL